MSEAARDFPAEIAVRLLDVPEFVIGMRAAAHVLAETFPTASEVEMNEGVAMACSVIGRWMLSDLMPCEGGPQ